MSVDTSTDSVELMSAHDLASPAEIFISRRSGSKRRGLGYRRFATAAEAIDFATQNFFGSRPDDLVMTVEDKRFNHTALKVLGRVEKQRTVISSQDKT